MKSKGLGPALDLPAGDLTGKGMRFFRIVLGCLIFLSGWSAQSQTYRSFTWDSNGITNIVVPTAEVWEILTWGTKTTTVRGLDTLFTLPGGGFLSTTAGQYYTKQNKNNDVTNPCGTILVGPATLARVPNAKVVDYLLVIQKLSTNNSTNSSTNGP